MPGNTVVINGVMEWYIGDSRMDELIKLLDEIGLREHTGKESCGTDDNS